MCIFKKHDFQEETFFWKAWFWRKEYFKIHDFEEEKYIKKHASELKLFRLVRFRINFLSSCQISNQSFTTRQILNILPRSTTCTFRIVFVHITMYSLRLQYLRQLDNCIRHRSVNTFCTLFGKDFCFWFRYGVPFSSLNLLDICKNQLLLIVMLQQFIKIWSRTCLTSFWKSLW